MQEENNNNNNNNNDINNVINPDVLSETKTENIFQNSAGQINVDINEIKNNAQDIIKKEQPKDISNLMNPEKIENKFFVDLNIDDSKLNGSNLSFKIKNAVDDINKKIEEIKINGTNIIKEEKNLDDSYEITIKIIK